MLKLALGNHLNVGVLGGGAAPPPLAFFGVPNDVLANNSNATFNTFVPSVFVADASTVPSNNTNGGFHNVFDANALAWFTAVEAASANFGPNTPAVVNNKRAFDTWIRQCKADASPIAGQSNWQQMVNAGGYISFQIGVSTFSVPNLFGSGHTYTGFIGGDYDPLLGLTGGTGRVLVPTGRNYNITPQNDISTGMYVNDTVANSSVNNTFVGTTTSQIARTGTGARCRSTVTNPVTNNSSLAGITGVSRSSSANYVSAHGTGTETVTQASLAVASQTLSFGARNDNTQNMNRRFVMCFAGRSVTLSTLNTATANLVSSIIWS